MKFDELLSASWKLYRLHARTIITLVFLCTFLPFVAILLASQGIAHYMGVTGTLAQYEVAEDHYRALLSSGLLSGMGESLLQSLETQEGVLAGLREELLPFFLVQGVLGVLGGLIGLLGTFALVLGFFGKFGSASSLLREARTQYFSLLGTLLASLFVLLLGGFILLLGLLLFAVVARGIALISEPGALFFGALALIALCFAAIYLILGLCFVLYEALGRKTRGFVAVRGVWARMQGTRLEVLKQCFLFSLTLFVCFLPLLLLKLFFAFGTSTSFSAGVDTLLLLLYTFVVAPLLYFFMGFLYKKII